MDALRYDEIAMLEQGPRVELGLWWENQPARLGRAAIKWHARDALDRARVASPRPTPEAHCERP